MFYGNFNRSRNYHNLASVSGARPTQPQPAGAAQHVPPVPVAASCGTSMAACCRMAMPMFPVDMGIDIASVRAEIEICKRRYQRDVWDVICGKALGSTTGGGSWKKPDEQQQQKQQRQQQEDESTASATSAAGATKRAPPAASHGNATTSGAASTVGSEQGKSEESATDEDRQQPAASGGGAEEKSAEEEEEATTDEAANANNLINRLAARHRSTSVRRRQQFQSRRGASKGTSSSSSGGGSGRWKDDWHNFNNSTDRRAAVRQPRLQLPPSGLVKFCSQQPLRTPRCQPDIFTAQPEIFNERRYDDDEDSSDDEDGWTAGRRSDDLADNYSVGTSDSSCGDDDFLLRHRFVPIFCGNWAEAGIGRSSRRQLRSRLRRRSGLTVTYHEPMPTPASVRSARF